MDLALNILATGFLGVLVWIANRIVIKVDATAADLTELKIEFAKLAHHSCPLVLGGDPPRGNGLDRQTPT